MYFCFRHWNGTFAFVVGMLAQRVEDYGTQKPELGLDLRQRETTRAIKGHGGQSAKMRPGAQRQSY
eukprot:1796109-Pleurochrysis_carterae.AAC.2